MQSFPKTFRFSISACGTHDLCRHHSHPASIVWSPESFSKDCRYLARIHLDNELEWDFVCGSVEHVPYLQAFVNLWSTSKIKFVLKHIFIKKIYDHDVMQIAYPIHHCFHVLYPLHVSEVASCGWDILSLSRTLLFFVFLALASKVENILLA